jgi:hypothetical protein
MPKSMRRHPQSLSPVFYPPQLSFLALNPKILAVCAGATQWMVDHIVRRVALAYAWKTFSLAWAGYNGVSEGA